MIDRKMLKDESFFVWYDQANKMKACCIAPNKLMLRKCRKPADRFLIGESNENSRIVEGIMAEMTDRLSMAYADGWCEVLAVGRKREYTKFEKDKYRVPKGFHSPVKKGDFVCIPESSALGRHWRCGVTGYNYDIVVSELEPFLWVPAKD